MALGFVEPPDVARLPLIPWLATPRRMLGSKRRASTSGQREFVFADEFKPSVIESPYATTAPRRPAATTSMAARKFQLVRVEACGKSVAPTKLPVSET